MEEATWWRTGGNLESPGLLALWVLFKNILKQYIFGRGVDAAKLQELYSIEKQAIVMAVAFQKSAIPVIFFSSGIAH